MLSRLHHGHHRGKSAIFVTPTITFVLVFRPQWGQIRYPLTFTFIFSSCMVREKLRRWEDPAHSRALTDPGLEPGTLQLWPTELIGHMPCSCWNQLRGGPSFRLSDSLPRERKEVPGVCRPPVAEQTGFEPMRQLSPTNGLAIRCITAMLTVPYCRFYGYRLTAFGGRWRIRTPKTPSLTSMSVFKTAELPLL